MVQHQKTVLKTIIENPTRRLSTTKYDRPEVTFTDTLQTNAAMKEKLENYTRVDDIDDVNLETHVRYVTLKDGKQRFCLGGILKKIHSKYVILSNGSVTWSVQRYHWEKPEDEYDDESDPIFITAFFKILSPEEMRKKDLEEVEDELEKKDEIISKQSEEIRKLRQVIEEKLGVRL